MKKHDSPLRKERERLNLTQLELAQRAGIAPRTVMNIESNSSHVVRPSTRRKILAVLGLPETEHARIFGISNAA